MALWGKTDDANSAPTWLSAETGAHPQNDVDNAYFVDITEAGVASNRAKGIVTPGWNLIQDIGNNRIRVENLVVMKVTSGSAGDLGVASNTTIEDTVVADRQITITVQPQDSTSVGNTEITFAVTATVAPTASLTYTWQEDSGTGTFVDLVEAGVYSGVATPTLAVSDNTGLDGYAYRVLITAPGATATSSIAIITEAV